MSIESRTELERGEPPGPAVYSITLNNGHIGGKDFILCREVVLFQRLKNTTTISLVPRNVSIVERLSFFGGSFIGDSTVYASMYMNPSI